MEPPDRARHEKELALLRAQLSEKEFGDEWAKGCTLTLDEAIGLALQETAFDTLKLEHGATVDETAE